MKIHNSVHFIFPPLAWIEDDREIPCYLLQIYPQVKRLSGVFSLCGALLFIQRLRGDGFEMQQTEIGGGWREVWLTQIVNDEPKIAKVKTPAKEFYKQYGHTSDYERKLERKIAQKEDQQWAARMYVA